MFKSNCSLRRLLENNFRRYSHWLVPLVLALCLFVSDTTLTSGALSGVSPTPLQFTSNQHVLGFHSDAWYVSNWTYALRVAFENANRVVPTSETPSSQTGDAAPLSRVSYADLREGIDLTSRAASNRVGALVQFALTNSNPGSLPHLGGS